MKTPIVDFLEQYKNSGTGRLHMPGHKGNPSGFKNIPGWLSDIYAYDITEIKGADDLYDPKGIIKESEAIASGIYGTDTFYVTEGSTQAIKAMIWLAKKHWENTLVPVSDGELSAEPQPYMFVIGKFHKALLYAATLLNVSLVKIEEENLCADEVLNWIYDNTVEEINPIGVYVTYPDYFGNVTDLAALKRELWTVNIPILVDGAHSAYFKFLNGDKYPEYLHPADCLADMSCASAHKTLPALTGAAYLHINESFSDVIPYAKYALDMFGSSSPSYLIMASLDAFNAEAEAFKEVLGHFCEKVDHLKKEISDLGFNVSGSDPLRIVVKSDAKYNGNDIASSLRACKCEPECCDEGYVVMMLTPYNTDEELARIKEAFVNLKNSSVVKSDSSESAYNCLRNFF
ncbi:MAG: amino acid decarboxylase [Lachnospiraceae bacterium]|nr:amino acid decarboxylase [Lachnospiraceae bacterium]